MDGRIPNEEARAPAPAEPPPKKRDWASLPHPLALLLTAASVLTGIASSTTAILNYKEARRNNRLPPDPTVNASLVQAPEGREQGEIEITVRNGGKTTAHKLEFRRAIGIGVRSDYHARGGDPDRLQAFLTGKVYESRRVMIDNLPDIVERQAVFREKPGVIDELASSDSVSLRMPANFVNPEFQTLVTKGAAYLVVGIRLSYMTDDGDAEVRTFCFERRPPFAAPAQKEALPACSEGSTYVFAPR